MTRAQGRVVLGLLVLLVGVAGARRTEAGPVVHVIARRTLDGTPLAIALEGAPQREDPGGPAFVLTSDDHGVEVLDPRSGALRGTLAAGSNPLTLAVDTRTGRVFVAGYDPGPPTASLGSCCANGTARVRVLDIGSGRLVQAVPVGLPPIALAVDAQHGRVFVSSCSPTDRTSRVSVLDARSGRLLRTLVIGPFARAVAVDTRRGHAFVVAADGSERGQVSMLDSSGSRPLRTVAVAPAPDAMAVDERTGRVFVLTPRSVGVLDSHSGALLRMTRLGSDLVSLAVDEQTSRVFATAETALRGTGSVSVLDARSGQLLRTVAVDLLPVAVAVDERHHRVFVASQSLADGGGPPGPGSVNVLDAASGAILRTVAIGGAPSAVAVDAWTGHVLVLSGAGTAAPAGWRERWRAGLHRWLPWLPLRRPRTDVVPAGVTVLAVSG